jgi:hypothetical protein
MDERVNYRLVAHERDGQWVAHAEQIDSHMRFGIECVGSSESDALKRLGEWLTWQREHQEALESLQGAEHAYHRAVAGSAFAGPLEGPTAIELQHESLELVEAARVRLDEVRSRRPH